MKNATADGKQLSRLEARALFEKAAGDMNCFSQKLSKDLPHFRDTLAGGVSATREAAWLIPDGPDRATQLKKVIDDLGVLRDGIGPAIEAMVGFQETVQGLPRITRELNVAKKRAGAVLAEVLDAMKGGRHLVLETIAVIETTVTNAPTEETE